MSDPDGERPTLTTEIRAANDGETSVVHVSGDLDLSSAAEFATSLKGEVSRVESLVLDLTDVPFMDSSGLREVILVSGELGKRLAVVVNPESAVQRLLEIAEVSDRINVHADVEGAVSAVAKGESGSR